ERERIDCRKLGQRICVPRRSPVRYGYQRHRGRVGAAQIEIEHLASCRRETNCECLVATAMITLSGKFQFANKNGQWRRSTAKPLFATKECVYVNTQPRDLALDHRDADTAKCGKGSGHTHFGSD